MLRCLLLACSGPHSGCGVCIRSAESVLLGRNTSRGVSIRDDLYLSREHFSVRSEGSNFRLIDLQSRNGTFLNGTRVLTSACLSDGDVVRAGGTEFRVEIHDDAAAGNRSFPSFSQFPQKSSSKSVDIKPEQENINDTRRYMEGSPEMLAIRSLAGIVKGPRSDCDIADSNETIYAGATADSDVGEESNPLVDESSFSGLSGELPEGVEESWLANYGLESRPSHRKTFYAFQSFDLNALTRFLSELHQRYDFYLIVNRAEIQASERAQLNKFIVEGQAGNLSNALLWVHGWKMEEFDTLFRMLFGKDCGIVFGLPVESKIRTKDLQQLLGPLSYPSVLLRTFRNENLVMIETLFQSIDIYIVEAKLDKPSWYLYTSPRFFGIYRR